MNSTIIKTLLYSYGDGTGCVCFTYAVYKFKESLSSNG